VTQAVPQLEEKPARPRPAEAGPYGAPELKRLHPIFLRRALFLASAGALFVTGAVAGIVYLMQRAERQRDVVVVPYRELAAPPPIDQPQVPQVAIAQPAAPPSVGAPLPVPDTEAEPEQTIATQEELSQFIGEGQGETGDSLIISPDVDPAFGEFVYVEELPEAVTRVPPEYPDIARQSGIEGTVQLQALVGKDGRVKDVKVVKGIPVLDEAAVSAVRQWVFKPALTNNKPVAVWVAVPVRFSLR
jgi:protein TonB